jgi:diguanylate cyclase (GGDEF)-like protein/PAS domain S-box-containing protein
MGLNAQFFIVPFILVAFLASALSVVAWKRSRSMGSLIFTLMMVVMIIWLVASALEAAAATYTGKVLAAKLSYLGISWAGSLWLLFSLEFVFPDRNFTLRLAPWMSIVPMTNIAMVMTNELHWLVWEKITSYKVNNVLVLIYDHGAWFWGFAVYTYLALAAGCLVMFFGIFCFRGTRRQQAVGLMIGMVLPWVANFLYIKGITFFPGMDITPYGFVLTGLIYSWMLFRLHLFNRAPQAHEFILENIGAGYLVVDERDRIAEANQLACQFLNLEAESVVGKRSASALERWPMLLELLSKPEHSRVEFLDGGEQPIYIEASRTDWLKGGKKKAGSILILHDITRRRIAEKGLRESERLYRLVVNTMPVGITITDEDGMVMFASPKLREIFQQDCDHEIIGQSVIKWVHPDDRSIAVMRLLKVIEDQENLSPQEYHLLRKDGNSFWGEVISTALIDDQGISQGMLGIIRDVSPRKELEFRLQHNLEQQTFINSLLQTLYRPHDLLAALSQVLDLTGLYTKASRVYLCKDSTDGAETSIVLEWCRQGISSRARESALFRYKAIPTWRDCMLDRGMVLIPDVTSASEDITEFMAVWNIRSLAVFPIYGSEERLYGFLAFDYCETACSWNADDLEILWNVCRIVSGAVAQRQTEEGEHRQRILASALHDTASALNSTLNFEEVLDRILTNLVEIVPHDAASIALLDPDGIVSFVRWRGYDATGEEGMTKLRMPISGRNTYRVMTETGSPLIISDTSMDRRWLYDDAYPLIKSYAGMPIKIKGKVAGFINLDSSVPDHFTSDLMYSLHVFADQAAVAIENARLYDATRRQADELSILNRIGLTITAGLDMDQILVSLYEQCRQALPLNVFYVALYDADSGKIEVPLYFQDGRDELVPSRNLHNNPGITGEVIRLRRTISLPDTLVPDVEEDYHIIRMGGRPCRSYVGVPLILLNKVVGVISMQSYQPYAYTPEQVGLLETIAIQTAIALQNARMFDQMKQLAITDSVTQLYTRRHFTSLGRNEVERAQRYNRRLSALMVDIDWFKRVNDTYGHTAGDQVLLHVANTCRQALRTTDIVGRWGGEEYVIVLPEADIEGAALIAERIRRMVAETEIPVAPKPIKVTVSIGVAALKDHGQALEALIDCADRALYAAKQGGRNQVQVLID